MGGSVATICEQRWLTYNAAWQAVVEEVDSDFGSHANTGTDRNVIQLLGLRGPPNINDALYRIEDRG